MKLHEDVNAFRVLINDIHERTGYRLDVLEEEKDLRTVQRLYLYIPINPLWIMIRMMYCRDLEK